MKLVLLRHGESQWNKENRFTGWTDVDLTTKGIEEAKSAGQLLKNEGYTFDVAYTSVLKRTIHTLWNVLDEMDLTLIPVFRSWRLNEKSYGALQGLNKAKTTKEYGEEQVKVNIPTGIPLVYELDEELKVLSKGYLGDQEMINKAMNSVKNQGKVNKYKQIKKENES